MELAHYVLPIALFAVAAATLGATAWYVYSAFVDSRPREGVVSLLASVLGSMLYAVARSGGLLEVKAFDLESAATLQVLILVVIGAVGGFWVGRQWRNSTLSSFWWTLTLLSWVGFVSLDFALSGNVVAHLWPSFALVVPSIITFLVGSSGYKAGGGEARTSTNKPPDSETKPPEPRVDRSPF
jgi:hypothetical protein